MENLVMSEDERRFITAFRQWFIEYPSYKEDEDQNARVLATPLMELFEQHKKAWDELKVRALDSKVRRNT